MNCTEAGKWLDAWHDGELDPAHSLEVEAHLAGCPVCTAASERMDALRAAVRHAPYHAAPMRLRRRVFVGARWRERAWMTVALALAACLLVFVAVRPGGSSAEIEKEVVSAHVRSLLADHLIDVASSDRHTVKPWFAGKLDFAPDVTPPEGFELVGGRLDYLDGRTVAALVYRRRQHTINVFTWPVEGSDRGAKEQSVQGYHVSHWVRGGMAWWAVSDLGAPELALLAK